MCCGPGCAKIPPKKPITSNHPLLNPNTIPHAYHHLGCGCDSSRTDRHDAIAAAMADRLRPEGPFRIDLKKNLGSSVNRGIKVDLLLTAYHRQPTVVALDITVSCSFTPSYLSAATHDQLAIFAERASEKMAKHHAGCAALDRQFIPAVFTTLGGIGPAEFTEFIDEIFRRSASLEIAAGGRGRLASERKLLFRAAVHAALIRSTHAMLHRRATPIPTVPIPPPPQ